MKITPAGRVYILGAMLCLALSICSRHFGDRGGPCFMASLTVAGIVYLLAMREFFRTPVFPKHVVVIGLALAAAWHIEFLRRPPGADDDIHRYVWDGRLQRLGYNPYIVVPSDPAVKALHTPETRSLNNPNLPSPYPPGAELFFHAVTAIQESTYALKVAFVVCDFAIVFALLDISQRTHKKAHLVLAYVWNPLLAVEVAGSGHIDIVGALLLVISVAALVRGWRTIAAVVFGLAVAVKFLPLVLVPIYWKRICVPCAALAATVVAVLYLPFLYHGHVPTGSLGTYVESFRFNGPIFAILDGLVPPWLLAGLAVLVGLAMAAWLRITAQEWSPQSFAWPMAAALFCGPVVFPWYLLWVLPFLASPSTLLIVIWTVSIYPTYLMWHWRTLGHGWRGLPVWVMWVEYGCVVLTASIIGLRRISRSTALQYSANP